MRKVNIKYRRVACQIDAMHVTTENFKSIKSFIESPAVDKNLMVEINQDDNSIDIVNMDINKKLFTVRNGQWLTVETDRKTIIKWGDMIFNKVHSYSHDERRK